MSYNLVLNVLYSATFSKTEQSEPFEGAVYFNENYVRHNVLLYDAQALSSLVRTT